MTEPQTTQSVPESESVPAAQAAEAADTDGQAGPPPAPEPEPLTPERISEWNAYYDRYVMGAALLLALIVSCNYVADSSLFLHLRTGKLIAERTAPVTTDEFSYTEAGQRWVDVPWLFQWSQAALYDLVYNTVPVDPLDQTANRTKADRIAIGALGLLDALVRLATAWVLLKIRHRGPGLWWSAICVTLAVGVFYDPLIGIAPGGLASVPGIGVSTSGIMPSSWGQLFLALEFLIAFRALDQGRRRYLWWLIPLFVLWANWDVSFLTGLLLLAAIVVGHWLDGGAVASPEGEADSAGLERKNAEGVEPADLPSARPVPASTAFLVLGLCAAACLLNPWTFRAYLAALNPFIQWIWPGDNYQLGESLSFFGRRIQQQLRDEGIGYVWTRLSAFYLVMVALGLASFVLNAAHFSWRRFLPFAVVSLLWGCLMKYSVEFALVFAVVTALNGQEWYHARFGSRGRLGSLWTLWSTGGRLVTLALIFAIVGIDITGWHVYKRGIHFGLGYDPDTFPIEAADFLARSDDLRGNILNTSMAQGDTLLWRAFPKRKTFADGRTRLFPRTLMEQWHRLRGALRDDDVATWKPVLDQYSISAIMIEPFDSMKTYLRLKDSPNWIPFYDDGRILMFGRADAPAGDLAFFKENRLEPDKVYRVANTVPPTEGPPTPTSWMDEVFQNRNLSRSQMRTQAAWRWLLAGPNEGGQLIPEPARCLLAIQDARIALSQNPDDTSAFRALNDAYRWLTIQETALLAGIPLTRENQPRIRTITPPPERLMNRFRQRVTSLNYAIQTTPTPDSDEARNELFNLNMQLFDLYVAANFGDLARDRLRAALAARPTEDHVPAAMRSDLQARLNQLDKAIEQIGETLEELNIEQQLRAVELAMRARQQGAVGLAISKLAEADASGDSPAVVKPQLLDLYCSTGQPDKALDLLNVGSVGDPNLGSEPGLATYRQGLVYYLLGNYLSSASLWNERSILQVRMERSNRSLMAGRSFARGDAMQATNLFLGIPSSLEQQATWEFDVAICLLEGGKPSEAAEHFTKALTIEPNLTVRPIAAYYLEKLGKPVPPPRDSSGATKPTQPGGTTPGAGTTPGTPAPLPRDATNPPEPAKAAPPEPAKVPAPAKGSGEEVPPTKAEDGKAAPK
jgi:tetratricopeptide (TPR) repeat protein